MRTTQENIDKVIALFNEVTQAHKRSPVQRYVQKQLTAGETVEILCGHPRWTSALEFSGSIDIMQTKFVINPALPGVFRAHLEKMKEEFEQKLSTLNL